MYQQRAVGQKAWLRLCGEEEGSDGDGELAEGGGGEVDVVADGSVTFSAVSDRLSIFAVGVPQPAEPEPEDEPGAPSEPEPTPPGSSPAEPEPQPTPPPSDRPETPIVPVCGVGVCGVGGGQIMPLTVFGLLVMRCAQRRRFFGQPPC